MKILIVARSLPFHRTGGMEVVAWDLACALQDAGHHISVLTTSLDRSIVNDCQKFYGINVISLENTRPGEYSAMWWSKTRKYSEEGCAGFDVILGVSAAANAMVGKSELLRRPLVVFQAHGTSWGEFISKWRQRRLKACIGSLKNLYWGIFKDWVYRRYDGVVAIGDLVDQQLKSGPGALLRGNIPLRLIPNGIPESVFSFDPKKRQATRHRLGISDRDLLLLSLCRLHPQKGVRVGLEAFALALQHDKRLHYAIVGDGPQEDELRDRARSLGVADRVHFIGRVERQNVPEWYCASDLFFFPTQRVEGLPINLLEALACGLPVIASQGGADVSLPLEFIPMGDVAGFCEAILRLSSGVDSEPHSRGSRLPVRYTVSAASSSYVRFFEELKQLRDVQSS